MDVTKLLPIGSVIRLNGATKCIMIFGVCQTNQTNNTLYDYIGVLWPEGNIGEEGQILFNRTDIEEVVFVGHDTDERQEFLQKLGQFYAENG